MRNCGRGAPKSFRPVIWLAGALSANHKEAFRATRSPERGFKSRKDDAFIFSMEEQDVVEVPDTTKPPCNERRESESRSHHHRYDVTLISHIVHCILRDVIILPPWYFLVYYKIKN